MQRSEAEPAAPRRAVVPLAVFAVGHLVPWGALAGLPYQAAANHIATATNSCSCSSPWTDGECRLLPSRS